MQRKPTASAKRAICRASWYWTFADPLRRSAHTHEKRTDTSPIRSSAWVMAFSSRSIMSGGVIDPVMMTSPPESLSPKAARVFATVATISISLPVSASGSPVRATSTPRRITRDVEVARTGDPEALTGKLIDIVATVANTLAAFGERLSGGDVIITGSITPPLMIERDENAITHALDLIGEVSVRFSWV